MLHKLPITCHSLNEAQGNYADVLTEMGVQIVEPQYDELFMKVELPNGWEIEKKGAYWSYLLDEKKRERANMFTKLAFWDQDAFLNFSKRFSISGEIADYDESLFKEQPEFIEKGYEIVLEDVSPEQYAFQDDHTIELLGGLDYDSCILSNGRIKRQIKKPKYVPNPDYHPYQRYEKYAQPFHVDVLDHDKSVLFRSQTVQTDYNYTKENHWNFFHHRDALKEKATQECVEWLEKHYPNWLNPLAYWD